MYQHYHPDCSSSHSQIIKADPWCQPRSRPDFLSDYQEVSLDKLAHNSWRLIAALWVWSMKLFSCLKTMKRQIRDIHLQVVTYYFIIMNTANKPCVQACSVMSTSHQRSCLWLPRRQWPNHTHRQIQHSYMSKKSSQNCQRNGSWTSVTQFLPEWHYKNFLSPSTRDSHCCHPPLPPSLPFSPIAMIARYGQGIQKAVMQPKRNTAAMYSLLTAEEAGN